MNVVDPIQFVALCWPHVRLYDKQAEALYSLKDNDETFLPAGNMLGKDFIASLGVLWFFLTRNPCRIVTTSAKDDHLRVLWGEIARHIQESKYPLSRDNGGPLVVNQRELRKFYKGKECPLSYVKGMVAGPDSLAAMQGHHIANTGDGIPRTAFFSDESSSVPHDYWIMARTWFHRAFVFGNTWECNNFFKHAVEGVPGTDDKGGDIPRANGVGYYRKVIPITVEDSPNVRLARQEIALGKPPSGRIIVPGVKSWEEYQKNLRLWDPIQICVSLHAQFYKGASALMFPPEWLNLAEQRAVNIRGQRKAKAIGVDSAQGGDYTAWCAVDEYGILELVAKKTPDTSIIVGDTLAFMIRHGVKAENVCMDAGGGGKEHADRLRQKGHNVRAVAFGETASSPNQYRRMRTSREKREEKEDRYVFKNRRAEMYGILRSLIAVDADGSPIDGLGFAIPREYTELRRQLAPIPLQYDEEGRMFLPPKNKKNKDDKRVTLTELIGRSPDEADALVLACFGMVNKSMGAFAGTSLV